MTTLINTFFSLICGQLGCHILYSEGRQGCHAEDGRQRGSEPADVTYLILVANIFLCSQPRWHVLRNKHMSYRDFKLHFPD